MKQKVFSIHALLIGLLSMMSTTAFAASYTPADLTGTGIDLEIGDVVTINNDDIGVNYGSNSIGKGQTITIGSDGTLTLVANSGTYNWGLAAGKKWHIRYEEMDLGFMKAQDIYLTQVEPKVAVTANSDGAATPTYWSTFYNATQGYTADASTTVYKAALNGTSSVTLTEVAGREIPAGQAVILKSTAASITLTPVAATTADMSGNVLKGGTSVASGNVAYTLSRGAAGTGAVGFYKFNGSLDGSKAHLEMPASAGTRGFIGFGDGTTAIEATAVAEDEAGEWYSLDGRRLSGKPARKGIYVKNGQKVVIK